MRAPNGSAVERLSAAPISWARRGSGVGLALPRDRVLTEMRDVGLKASALGALGHLGVWPEAGLK